MNGMTLWRVSNYATLDGAGGLYTSGRWHNRGTPVIYCSEDPSTALLETLVHLEIDVDDRPRFFQVLKIESRQALSVERVPVKRWASDWEQDQALTRQFGDVWLSEKRSLLLEVPSVLVPERRNYLVNPAHAEMKYLRIRATYAHPFDARFFH